MASAVLSLPINCRWQLLINCCWYRCFQLCDWLLVQLCDCDETMAAAVKDLINK